MAEDAAEPGSRKTPQKIKKPVGEGNADRLFSLGRILTSSGTEAILDNLPTRRCATAHTIPVCGTLGLVLIAIQRGRIPATMPVLLQMSQAGMLLSNRVMNKALTLVGE